MWLGSVGTVTSQKQEAWSYVAYVLICMHKSHKQVNYSIFPAYIDVNYSRFIIPVEVVVGWIGGAWQIFVPA